MTDFLSVSLVLPVRNEERFIQSSLGSILAQDYPGEMEILVVDGRSTDRTLEIVEKMASKKGKPIRIMDNPGINQPSGVNKGIEAATGEIILRIDAHAVYAQDYVSRCIEVMKETGAGNVGGPQQARPIRNTVIAKGIALAHHSRFGLGREKFHDVGTEGEVNRVWLGCFRREVFRTVGLFNEAFPRTEDIDINSRLRHVGYKVWVSPRIRSWYFCRGTLRELWKQNWANGKGIVDTLLKNRRAVNLHHIVPLLFVLSFLSLLIAGLFFKLFWILLIIELLVYGILSVFFSLRSVMTVHNLSAPDVPDLDLPAGIGDSHFAIRNSRWWIALCLPLVFATLHSSYGLGSLVRLISWPFRRKSGGNAERGNCPP